MAAKRVPLILNYSAVGFYLYTYYTIIQALALIEFRTYNGSLFIIKTDRGEKFMLKG